MSVVSEQAVRSTARQVPSGRLQLLRKELLHQVSRPFAPDLRWITVLAFAAAVFYSTFSFQRFSRFQSAGYDLGIFDQVVRQYSQLAAPYSQIKGAGFNILGDHFHPILATLAPLYWLWDDPRMLGIAMAVLLAVSVFPVYFFTRSRLGWLPGLLVSAGYLFWWPIQGLVGFDFHEIAFGVPLVAWIIHALDQRKYRTVVMICLALLMVREDMGFMVMAVALIVLLRRQWRLGIVLTALGLTAYLAVTGVVIPHFNAHQTFGYWQYSDLGPTLGAAVLFILAHPLKTLALLFNNESKQLLWAALFAPVGLLPLGSAYALLAAPILLSRLLSDRPGTWGTGFQYNAVLAPILVMAAVDVLAKLIRRHEAIDCLRTIAPALFLAGVFIGTALAPSLFPLHQLFMPLSSSATTHIDAQQRIVSMVPDGAFVEADDRLVPHLTNRTSVGMIGRQSDQAQWAIVDLTQDNTGGGGDGNYSPSTALKFLASKGFRETYRENNILLLQKSQYAQDSESLATAAKN
ncbi:DUF2079 domain-containing protein [Pseudarthrobacter sp. fls2-241-R2A-127]|uniref:DUF2079 domain-containing protein n=1 Tax=Pseudarthrobacter sp. fls2-241-R2A-127 TaxID=3040303 RepID=UPI0025557DA0|nr:DUF2079 domain-containing protein [Pseudarthrobacter sp. fls2-241-R2A-127]